MYAYIKGKLVEAKTTEVTVDVHGIGYQIFVPASTLSHLPKIGQEVVLHTSLVIREFVQALYGFISSQEKDLFAVLTNVSGIGPKLALSIIGHLPLSELQDAITQHDIVTISRVPGIGKKMAERMIVEMRDKLPNLFTNTPAEYSMTLPTDPRSQTIRDAMSALINLGYSQVKAKRAIEKTIGSKEGDFDLPSLITDSLKNV